MQHPSLLPFADEDQNQGAQERKDRQDRFQRQTAKIFIGRWGRKRIRRDGRSRQCGEKSTGLQERQMQWRRLVTLVGNCKYGNVVSIQMQMQAFCRI